MSDESTAIEKPWPRPWARTVAFFFGLGVATWEIVGDDLHHFALFAVAAYFTGLPFTRGLEAFFSWVGDKR